MLLSCFRLIGAGLFRIPLDWVPPALAFLKAGGPDGLVGLDLMLVYACIAWDTWHHRRLHPALVAGALLIASEDLPFIWRFPAHTDVDAFRGATGGLDRPIEIRPTDAG